MIMLYHMKKFYTKENKNERGFTLIETLVATSIFATSILALLVVLSQGIANTGYAKKKIIAGYLGQEGIEYIRNLRDTYVLYSATSQAGWDSFNTKLTSSTCQAVNGCYFDDRNVLFTDNSTPMTDLLLTACPSSSCPAATLLYDATTGKYNYVSGTNSGYNRKMRISQISANETKVFSTISWTQGSGNYSISFSESLFNWVE